MSRITVGVEVPALELSRPVHMSSREIRIPLNAVVAVLQDLNEFVVSLDQLGSRIAFGTAHEPARFIWGCVRIMIGKAKVPSELQR
ncbi:hypothetical protein [Streptomyces cadmiisoli]|uniref:hypothetical protein n=1 Tax=Streptomyces cadmiisoli TaxID=2184053 RepID=UPI0013A6974C|nr:hypothetical protein [Streptomyces cadmiisoli]